MLDAGDTIFQLTFPQREMLDGADFELMFDLVLSGAPRDSIEAAAKRIRRTLNPHPARQRELNVPRLDDGTLLSGMQHKYRESLLFFPSQGQTCHAYCTYCFRWAQFVGDDEIRFASNESSHLVQYVRAHKELNSVLFTGGDPLVMRTKVLRRYVEPLLDRSIEHLSSIRFGSKAPAYWPQRFVTDRDADDLLRLFEEVVAAGLHVCVVAHYSHPRELMTPLAREALRRVRGTGAVVRCQAPVIRHINDSADTWAEMWREQVRLGAIPYYMFVERDTGPRSYFEVPLVRALGIYTDAYRQVSGLGRTVRGPSMSTTPGKVVIDGITTILGQRVFALRFLQARNPAWVGQPFFAEYDAGVTWFDQLIPAFGEKRFFFEAGDEFSNDPMRHLPVLTSPAL